MPKEPTQNPSKKHATQAERELQEIEGLAESSNPKDSSPEIARDRQLMPEQMHHRGAKRGPGRTV